MPRKHSVRTENAPEHRGLNDIVGVVLLGLALLLFVAMSSFEPRDVSANRTDYNQQPHNLSGPAGAYIAHFFFQAFGAGALCGVKTAGPIPRCKGDPTGSPLGLLGVSPQQRRAGENRLSLVR